MNSGNRTVMIIHFAFRVVLVNAPSSLEGILRCRIVYVRLQAITVDKQLQRIGYSKVPRSLGPSCHPTFASFIL
jgi:hypothetical protein